MVKSRILYRNNLHEYCFSTSKILEVWFFFKASYQLDEKAVDEIDLHDDEP